jgi:hypothetical protein
VGGAQAAANIVQGRRIDEATFGQVAGIIRRHLAQEQIIRSVLKMISEADSPRSHEKACETEMPHREEDISDEVTSHKQLGLVEKQAGQPVRFRDPFACRDVS